jgi:thiol:disulfide interchange protein
MIRVLHICLLGLFTFCSVHSVGQIEFKDLSLEDALALSQSTGKDIFIDFRADWCKPCIAMEKETFSNLEVGNAINSTYIPIQFDVDFFNGMDVKEEYNVEVLPTILIINSSGTVQRRLIGQKTPYSLMSELDLPYDGGEIVYIDPQYEEADTQTPITKKTCFLKRWWNKLIE